MTYTGCPRKAKIFATRPRGPRIPTLKISPVPSLERSFTSTTILMAPEIRRAETKFSAPILRMTCPGATSNAAKFCPSRVAANKYPSRFSDDGVHGSSPTSAEVRSYMPAAWSNRFTMATPYRGCDAE